MFENSKTPSKALLRTVCFIAFFVGAFLGWLAAYQLLGSLTVNNIVDINIKAMYVIYACSALLFAIVFTFTAAPVLRYIYRFVYRLENKLSVYSSKDITAAAIGLILGLLIAFLLSDLIKLIPIYIISTTIIIVVYITLSLIGIRLGIKYVGEIIIVNKNQTEILSSVSDNIKILDSSVIIDGRILDLVRTGFLEGPFIVPAFIMNQLKSVSESQDVMKRNRGRRGLDILHELQRETSVKVILSEVDYPDISDIDTKILKFAEQFSAKVITNDYNLNKLAGVIKVVVLNINELSNAIKPVVIPGEKMTVNIVKAGKEHGQGIGYLEDGTMIVVENGGDNIGETVEATVTTALQTNAGRLIFTRIM